MAQTAAKLRAVVEADTEQAKRKLAEFGHEVSNTRRKTDQEVKGIADTFRGTLASSLVMGGVQSLANGLQSILTGLWNTARSTVQLAYEAVRDYEMLAMGLRQLTAVQLLQGGAASDMAQALTLAEEPAKRLIEWVEKLAIESPFNSDGIAQTIRMAEAFGFTEGQAKRLTQALVDFSSGAGLPADYMNRIMLNLAQIAMQGKATTREMKELAMTGLPVNQILSKALGVGTEKISDMLEKGLIPAHKALDAITKYMETNFAGAAERAATTWQGLQSSIEEIKTINLREVFQGVFDAVRPEVAGIVDFLSSDRFRETMRGIGTALGQAVKDGVEVGKKVLATLFDAEGLSEFMEQIKGGEFTAAIHDIVGKIEFGVLNAISIAKEVATILFAVGEYVGELLKVFISNLGQLLTIFGNVIDTKVEALAARAEAMIRFNASPSYNRAAEQAAAMAAQAQGNLGDYVGMMSDELAPAYDVMMGKINDAKAARQRETDSINEQRDAYYALGEARAAAEQSRGRNSNSGRGIRTSGRLDPRTGQIVPDKVDQVLSPTTFDPIVMGAGTAGEKAGKKMADEMEKAVDKMIDSVKGKLSQGMQFSIGLGKMPGLDPLAPGSNGPFEKLFRLQDVAMNLGTGHEGKDTRKFYQEFFDGMGFDQAKALATQAVTDFQRGNFTDQVLQYIDIDKLRALTGADKDAAASQDRLAKLIGGDQTFIKKMLGTDLAGQGIVLSDKDSEALARSLKTGVMKGIDKVAAEQPSVMEKMLTFSTDDSGTKKTTDTSGSAVVAAMVKAIDADLAANGANLTKKGAEAWGLFETGFIDGASKSTAFVTAVDKMVDNSIARYIPTNQ